MAPVCIPLGSQPRPRQRLVAISNVFRELGTDRRFPRGHVENTRKRRLFVRSSMTLFPFPDYVLRSFSIFELVQTLLAAFHPASRHVNVKSVHPIVKSFAPSYRVVPPNRTLPFRSRCCKIRERSRRYSSSSRKVNSRNDVTRGDGDGDGLRRFWHPTVPFMRSGKFDRRAFQSATIAADNCRKRERVFRP